MSPEYVRPYVKAQKNDDRDAEAIAEAATRPTMRFVELKSEEQLDLQTLHRARDRLVGERTALINQLRGMLLERGIIVPQGRRKLELHLAAMMAEASGCLSARGIRLLIEDMRAEWRELDRRIAAFDDEFAAQARSDEAARLLDDHPGHRGPERDRADRGDRQRPRRSGAARDLAAWLGLGATADDHRRQAAAAGHQQARQRLSAQAADPWRPCGLAVPCPEARRRSATGSAVCWRGRTRTPSWWRWQASWHGSPGRCCGPGRPIEMKAAAAG